MQPISVREARLDPTLIRHAIAVDGAVVELCEYPVVRAERVRIVEEQSILTLGLSRMLAGSEGRFSGDPRRPFERWGTLNLRPAGEAMEINVTEGAFHTLRIRFEKRRLASTFAGERLSDTALSACIDIHSPPIEQAMLRLAEEAELPRPDTPALAEALVTLIVHDLGRFLQSIDDTGPRRGGLSGRALRQAMALIDAPGEPPTIDSLAGCCGLSRHHFIRCFRQSTGISPGVMVRRKRIDRAKALLAEGSLSIAEIASILAYAGPPSFSTAFKRETGRSPGEWRAQMH